MSERVVSLDIASGIRVLRPAEPQEKSALTVLETDSFYEIRSALPGVGADDVVVGIVDDVLTIAAKLCTETQRTLGAFFSVDYRVSLIEQSFALPSDADTHSLTTAFCDGVFRILLARVPTTKVVSLFPH